MTNVMILRLRVPVRGTRYDSAPGERRTIMWRHSIPRVLCRSLKPEMVNREMQETARPKRCKHEIYNDHFQNYRRYGLPKAQLVIAVIRLATIRSDHA